jgi:hypothetical protein
LGLINEVKDERASLDKLGVFHRESLYRRAIPLG